MKIKVLMMLSILIFVIVSCSGSKDGESVNNTEVADAKVVNIGIGPITKVELGTNIDQDLVKFGKETYDLKCTACHKLDEKFIGPPPKGIMERRSPEWIMNMILNPEEMIAKDPVALKLLAEYNFAPMANQSLTEDEARAILEYFRTL